MSFLDVSRRYLKRLGIPFEVIAHKTVESTFEVPSVAGIPSQQLVKTVLLADERGAVLVSLAADQGLDFEALNTQLKRRLSLSLAKQHHQQLHGFAPIMLPPWHRLYDIPWVVEHTLCEQPVLYFASGSPKAVIKLDQSAFLQLCGDAQISHFGRHPRNYLQETQQTPELEIKPPAISKVVSDQPSSHLRERLAQGVKLPVMPGLTADLVALKTDVQRDVVRATLLIEQDPVLVANLLRYAASPFFGYQGRLGSVQEAIHHVLGLDQALDLAIGLSLCGQFAGPKEGRLGLGSLWRDAFYSANVSQFLAAHSNTDLKSSPGTAFLAGLLHNIGYLVLAQMFPTEYALFNRLVTQQSVVNVRELEQRTLGVTHTEAGKVLLKAWGLDELLFACTEHHHDDEYEGEHATFVHLVAITDLILAQHQMGDMPPLDISWQRLKQCGLDRQVLELCQAHLLLQQNDLELMVSQVLAA